MRTSAAMLAAHVGPGSPEPGYTGPATKSNATSAGDAPD
jgi:hypothetical protein